MALVVVRVRLNRIYLRYILRSGSIASGISFRTRSDIPFLCPSIVSGISDDDDDDDDALGHILLNRIRYIFPCIDELHPLTPLTPLTP